MPSTIDEASPRAHLEDLPDSVKTLSVASALVEAGITTEEASHLDYIVDQVYFQGEEHRERIVRFAILIVLSTMIAAFGLLADSVAVVIGAMLVAPLMTPIMGTAVSLVLSEPAKLAASARTVAAGAGGAIAVGWFIALIASGGITSTNIPGEVLGRTAPGLLDLGIAIAAGLAGGYLMVDRKAAASAAGVAIAVALVPPLAVVGICLELGAFSLAAGAVLLFSTNFVAIVLSASAVIVISSVIPNGFLRVRFRQLRLGFTIVVIAVIAVSVPLAIHTSHVVQEEQFRRLVARSVAEWDPRSTIIAVQTSSDAGWTVSLQLSTPPDRSAAWRLAEIITEKTGRDIDLDVSYVSEERDRASTR